MVFMLQLIHFEVIFDEIYVHNKINISKFYSCLFKQILKAISTPVQIFTITKITRQSRHQEKA